MEEKNFVVFTYKLLFKFGRDRNKQTDWCCFFSRQSACGLTFQEIFLSEDCKIIVSFSFLTDHDRKIDCTFSLNGKRDGTVAHAFYPGVGKICGDIYFDNECFTHEETKTSDVSRTFFRLNTRNRILVRNFPFKSSRFCDGTILQTWFFIWKQTWASWWKLHSFDSRNVQKTENVVFTSKKAKAVVKQTRWFSL